MEKERARRICARPLSQRWQTSVFGLERPEAVLHHEPGDLRALPAAGQAAFAEVHPAIHARALASAAASDSEWNVRVIVLGGSPIIGAGNGTAPALKLRVNVMSSVPKNWRRTSAPADVGSAQG